MTDITKIRPPTGIVPPGALHTPGASYKDGSPIALYASVQVEANTQNTPPVAALRNPTPYPIEINEIRFHGYVTDDSGSMPGMFGVRLDLDGDPVAQDFVPTWLVDDSEQITLGESLTDAAGGEPKSGASYRWRLATPLLLLPGETINCEFINYGLTGSMMTLGALYTGRVIVGHPLPGSRVLPYLASWANSQVDITPWATGDTTPIAVNSTEKDLVNASNEIVTVRKLTGRLMVPSANNKVGGDTVQPIIDMLFDFAGRVSSGYELTREFVPFRLFFGSDTRSFPAQNLVLAPGDYIMAQVLATFRNITPYDNGGTLIYPTFVSPVIPQIGMVGERIVAL